MADYDVVLLIEQELTAQDARQVRSLHEGIEEADGVLYTVLIPVEEGAAQIEAGISGLGAGEVLASPMVIDPEAVQEMQRELLDEARSCVQGSIDRLVEAGAKAVGEVVKTDPIQA